MKKSLLGLGSLLTLSLVMGSTPVSFAQAQCDTCGSHNPFGSTCPACVTPVAEQCPLQGSTQYAVPTVNLKFEENINPLKAKVGQSFKAVTQSPIMVNDKVFPSGSVMRGEVIAVQKPDKNCPGRIQMIFTGLVSPTCELVSFTRPSDIQGSIAYMDSETTFSKVLQAPFRFTSNAVTTVADTGAGIIHEVGQTAGGMITNTGGALYDFVTLQPAAGLQKTGQVLFGPFQGVGNIAQTTFQGGKNLFVLSPNESLYAVSPTGEAITSIQKDHTYPITLVQTCVNAG